MLKNYFKIAFRQLTRHKLFSLINIFCLGTGITCSIIIGMYILNQRGVNSPLKNLSHQYLIKSNWKVKEMGWDITTLGPLAKTMKEEYPALIENYYRYNPVANVVTVGNNHFKENVAIGDTTLVSMYGFPVLYGDKEKAFTNINSAVITASVAQQLFGVTNAVGKTFSLTTTVNDEKQEYMVTAVLKDIPSNSVTGLINTDYNIFIPTTGSRYYSNAANADPASGWSSVYEIGMLELKPGVDPAAMTEPFKQVLKKYTDQKTQNNLKVELAPLTDYHLKTNNGAVQKMITALSFIAAFILLMAIINFVNINIGTSAYRVKEIGLRKVFGGIKRQLMIQFISEALVLTFFAALISLLFYELLRHEFMQILSTALPPFWQFDMKQAGLFFALITAIGLVSGIYPAFVLSSADTINSVKGKTDSAKSGLVFRKSLLIFQFSLAIVVFITALIVSRQMSFVFSKDLGYNKEELMVVDTYPKRWDSVGVQRMKMVKQQLLTIPEVKDASLSFEIPVRKPTGQISLFPRGQNSSSPLMFAVFSADQDFGRTFGLKMLAGSFFSQSGSHIPNQIVLSESAAKSLGFPDASSAIGRQINQPAGNPVLTIAGVIKDYNYSSLQQKIEPLVVVHFEEANMYRFMNLRLSTRDFPKAVEDIKKKWKALLPEAPFEYIFMDDQFQSLYKSELQLQKAAGIATALNLLIVSLGVFGMVAFTLVKRNKEVAVRKVLGAGLKNILLLFIKDYAGLLVIANIIAWPVAYVISNRWLENYAYRIDQNAAPYITVFAFIFIIVTGLITAQCFKTAVANPVKSLRAE